MTQEVTYSIQGMHCANCVTRVKDALTQLPGVVNAEVTLQPPMATVQVKQSLASAAVNSALAHLGRYSATQITESPVKVEVAEVQANSVYPLYLILAYITGTVGLIGAASGIASPAWYVNGFMAGFFLVFSFFKLLDIKGFASSYQMYDLIARKVLAWAFAYPVVELAFGVAFLIKFMPFATNIAEIVLMLIGAAGVLKALMDKRSIRCACLGSVVKLPMTTVSMVEDLGMAALGALALVLG